MSAPPRGLCTLWPPSASDGTPIKADGKTKPNAKAILKNIDAGHADKAAADDSLFAVKRIKTVPYAFVLDAIAALSLEIRPFLGCLAVYVGDKIVLILREKGPTRPPTMTVAGNHRRAS